MKALRYLVLLTLIMPMTATAQDEKKSPPATPVIVAEVQSKTFADEVEALGTLKANESVDLTSSVTELVTKINFTDNQRVAKGDILVEMDAAEELAELAEQQSMFDEAQKQVDRLSPLVKRGAASASVLGENQRDLAGAKARLDAIQSRIDQRVITAPYDGTLGLRNMSVGALAQPGTMITTIDDDSVMKLDFSVPEIFLATLTKGVVINATTEAYPEKIFEGTISSIDSRIDPVTRSIEARALIDNKDGLLKPGLLMQVVVKKNPREALVIPEETITSVAKNNFVWVVTETDGKITADKRPIKLGQRQYGEAEILSGLEKGERIVTHGTLRLRPGGLLEITATETDNEPLNDMLKQGGNKETSKNKKDTE